MTERISKSVLIGATAALMLPVLAYLAYSRPWYFTSTTNIAGLIFLELLIVAVWHYRRVFFPVVLVSFLLAGVNLPVGRGWAAARWVVLSVGALAGLVTALKDRLHFGFFHVVAFFAVLASLISAAVSRYPDVALLKVLSILLLFVYAGTGARLAANWLESRFFNGLLTGCEIFVGVNALFYAIGIEAMGNPNSLGAAMGVVGAPILLWGVLLGGEKFVQRRRLALYAVCMYLTFSSHSRAGIAAALLSSGLLCLALRRYKLLVEGLVVLVIVVAAVSLFRPDAFPTLASSVVYKDREEGVLNSRISPWRSAMDSISDHPWFGTGLGTTASGGDASEEQGKFASSGTVTAEHGSSYLAILAGVGVVGALPFTVLLLLISGKVLRTIIWMRRYGSASHAAIPLATIMVAGMLHAAFEDWMFAPGNYVCVFFWSLAFVLIDVAPSSQLSRFALTWHPRQAQQPIGGVAPSR
ncbi:MAG TPA: O-antigen ligase family protein [Candidatus Dormibacteraeota bacterium]|nr:O-antigen ligase family protein [Candidatus Dormibacteraeota bacterium]